eukprot:1795167-Alexandrium_andersonii.AAC.1
MDYCFSTKDASEMPHDGPGAEGSRLSRDSGASCPAQGPPARGHCGPGGVQRPQIRASPQGPAQDGQ